MNDALSEHESRVASRVLAEESARREHLVVSLSGAHAYGFPSPDSDLDLKAVHVDGTAALLGLSQGASRAERMEVIDGVEIDYSSNEIQSVLMGVVQGNGNFIERFVSAIPLQASSDLSTLAPLVQKNLSRRIHRHYRGFARSQWMEWEKGGFRSAKKLLYVLRTTLTGTHALLTGTVMTDVTRLLDLYGFDDARELIERKRQGERTELDEGTSRRFQERTTTAFETLEKALAASPLPEDPQHVEELENGLLDIRRARF